MNVVDILGVLADGEFHSGEELGQAMGVSRTAVWKHLRKLDELGLELESVKGKGYRLHGGLDLLSQEAILKYLPDASADLISRFEIFDSIESTNSYLLERGAHGHVCMAERQMSGRGRRGRAWVSPFAKNVYLSVCWMFQGGAQSLEGLSLAVGVAVAEAIESLGIDGVQLKWPNDVLHNGRKLGGILLEMSGDVSGECKLVLGIGLNVKMPDAGSRDIDQAWVDLSQLGLKADRNHLAAAILQRLMPMLASYDKDGFAQYRERWQSLDAFYGKEVYVSSAQQRTEGVANGVAESGALRLLVGDVEREFSGGEVSLRLLS
ncbi:bifunctional biotin--[acetyl-CoA-carboxylase] ligase/biotin operon repressor BirA [uncultured Pseudoteredinibacter sp.]|uniref:bifunctional biotin--[acetyl-CoA-carboxylase] ligase/biotin operon repressor BirA n=1 Tax=uncultured Pseudoteredinibacter sp. TaxID=1641701 RepID=UPI00260F20CD|nr:bifunctional biotin--[acetyl-CoA-carboxylase] ligase/biotin operon repressor BirA [uncultured Pseudoteredinibacter sp.]